MLSWQAYDSPALLLSKFFRTSSGAIGTLAGFGGTPTAASALGLGRSCLPTSALPASLLLFPSVEPVATYNVGASNHMEGTSVDERAELRC